MTELGVRSPPGHSTHCWGSGWVAPGRVPASH